MNINVKKSIGWFVAGRFSFVLSGVVIKFFPFAALQYNWIRGLFVTIVLFPGLYKKGLGAFKTRQPVLLVSRIILATIGLMCHYYALQHMTFAKATTLVAAQTIFAPLFAKIFLGEEVGLQRWLAVGLGYLGIWVAVDPVYSEINFAEFIALVCAVIVAVVSVMSKKLVKNNSPELLVFYAGIASVLIVSVLWKTWDLWATLFNAKPWPAMSIADLLMLLVLMGPTSFLGQYGYLKAYRYADLSFLAPFEYTSFIFAIFFGYVVFKEVPDAQTWVGMILIIFATLLVTSYEMRRKKIV